MKSESEATAKAGPRFSVYIVNAYLGKTWALVSDSNGLWADEDLSKAKTYKTVGAAKSAMTRHRKNNGDRRFGFMYGVDAKAMVV